MNEQRWKDLRPITQMSFDHYMTVSCLMKFADDKRNVANTKVFWSCMYRVHLFVVTVNAVQFLTCIFSTSLGVVSIVAVYSGVRKTEI